MSPLSIILLSPVKKSSPLNQERNMHRWSTVYQWNWSKADLNRYVGGFWSEDNKRWTFSTGGSVIIMDYVWSRVNLVDYCDVFYQLFGLSFWRHLFTAEDIGEWCKISSLKDLRKHCVILTARLCMNCSVQCALEQSFARAPPSGLDILHRRIRTNRYITVDLY